MLEEELDLGKRTVGVAGGEGTSPKTCCRTVFSDFSDHWREGNPCNPVANESRCGKSSALCQRPGECRQNHREHQMTARQEVATNSQIRLPTVRGGEDSHEF